MTHNFHPTSLREYDIRGIIDETLGAADAYAIGRGFGTLIARAGTVKGGGGSQDKPRLHRLRAQEVSSHLSRTGLAHARVQAIARQNLTQLDRLR